jgi:anti-repressor protein
MEDILMEELIKLTLNEKGESVVSARELHVYLESKQDFSTWIKARIEKYGFIENQDFVTFHKIVERAKLIEYALTLDMAKEVSMVEANDKGQQARRYFIACEKASTKPLTQLEIIAQSALALVQQEKRTSALENKVQLIEAKLTTHPDDFMSVAGYANLNKVPLTLPFAAELGRKASRICKNNGVEVHKINDPRFGQVGIYPFSVLDEVFRLQSKIM